MPSSRRSSIAPVVEETSREPIRELLDKEENQLLELEQQLARSKEITKQMCSVLGQFQTRLTELEKDILPVYATTAKTRGLFKNIDGVIKEVENINGLLDTANKVEQRIENGPRGDFEQYGKTLKDIGRAKRYLKRNGSSFKAAPGAFAALDKLEHTGKIKCDDALGNLIGKLSVPVEPLDIFLKIKTTENPAPPDGRIPIHKEKLKELQILSEALQQYPKESFRWKREYLIARKSYLLQSLQKLNTTQLLNEFTSEKKRKVGAMHPFIRLFVAFVPLLEGEKLLAAKLLPNQWTSLFCAITEPSVDYFIETGESLLKVYQHKSVFLRAPLLDVLVYLRCHFERLSSALEIPEALKLLTDMDSFLNRMEGKVKSSFEQISEEIRSSHCQIRESGTVDQLTSNVLSFLSQISPHKDLVSKIVWPKVNSNEDPFAKCILSMLNDLIGVITQKASEEKNITLKCIYAMNNIQHIITKIQKSEMSPLLPKSFFEHCEKEIHQFSMTYKTAWNKCISLLMDQSMKKGKSEKHFKAQIQNFNQEFEAMFRSQQQYVVPNKELKEQIVSELKLVLEPCYDAFYERMKQSSLSTDNSLMKYPPKVMQGMLDKMFIGIANTSSPKGKKKLLSKLKG